MDQPNQVEYLALTFLLTFTNHSAKTNRLHLQSRVQGATPKVASNVQTAALKCHELDFCYWAFWNRTFDHFILMLPWNEIVPIIASYYQSFTHHFLFFYLPFFFTSFEASAQSWNSTNADMMVMKISTSNTFF